MRCIHFGGLNCIANESIRFKCEIDIPRTHQTITIVHAHRNIRVSFYIFQFNKFPQTKRNDREKKRKQTITITTAAAAVLHNDEKKRNNK